MKTIKKVKKTSTVEETTEVACNCCGKVLTKEDIMMGDITDIDISFGYGSKHDTEVWKIDICDACLDNWVKTFKFPPHIKDYM